MMLPPHPYETDDGTIIEEEWEMYLPSPFDYSFEYDEYSEDPNAYSFEDDEYSEDPNAEPHPAIGMDECWDEYWPIVEALWALEKELTDWEAS